MLLRKLASGARAALATSRGLASTARTMEVSNFPGASSQIVNELKIQRSKDLPTAVCYRIMDKNGDITNPKEFPQGVTPETIVSWYKHMVTLQHMDQLLYNAQRQGRISFYMTASGEEATHIGSASALKLSDVVYAQYREAGVLLYRGFSIEQAMNQCFSNSKDLGKGRQMPVHYGSRALNFHTISSPLTTQLPQASGAAYALKRQGKGNMVMCYFGDGAASEGDAHAAMNFASTLDCPVVFFCRNNGYAISTPTHEQYRGDGIVSRAPGYGIDSIRVDGNDIFAVHNATRAARDLAVSENRPVLVEAMTYRIGHHSTSDDSFAYRGKEEVTSFTQDTPIERLGKYMRKQGFWDNDKEEALADSVRSLVRTEFEKAEKIPKPHLDHMFLDVLDVPSPRLEDQRKEMYAHVAKYPTEYPTDVYSKTL